MGWALDRILRARAANRLGLTDYSRMHAAIAEPLQHELGKILSFSSEFETELYVRRFEMEFARDCDRRFAVGTQSGTAALQLTLGALGVGPGDEVITVPYTYIATALAITGTGARPVFVDIDPANFNMDPARIEAAITPRTKAILPVHLFGQAANMIEIMKIAKAHGLNVVEDACQAFRTDYDGQRAGTFGDAGCFSFSTPKNLSGCGNGGMIVSNNEEIIERVRRLRNPESNAAEVLSSRRTPCYLDAVQIAFLRAKLPLVPAWIASRREQADFYRAELNGVAVALPAETARAYHTYYRFAVRTQQRRGLRQWLNKRGIRAVNAYSPCLHRTQTFSGLGYASGAFPISEAAENDTLWLPLSPFHTETDRARIVQEVRNFFTTSSRGTPISPENRKEHS